MSENPKQSDGFSQFLEEANRKPSWLERLQRRLPERVVRYWQSDPEAVIAQRIAAFAEASDDQVTFVQIGSCDGLAGDPLREHIVRHGWRGVVVEPVPSNFRRLQKTYEDHSRVICRNVAISTHPGTCTFYCIEAPQDVDLPAWTREIGSLDRDHLVKHVALHGEIERYITAIEVPCSDFQSLVEQAGFERIDVLHTDVEGFDLEVLKQVDFSRWRPRVVLFEDFHMNAETRAQAINLLHEAGYDCIRGGMNVLAVQRA